MEKKIENAAEIVAELRKKVAADDRITLRSLDRIERNPKANERLLWELCRDFDIELELDDFQRWEKRRMELRRKIDDLKFTNKVLQAETEVSYHDLGALWGLDSADAERFSAIDKKIIENNERIKELEEELWVHEHSDFEGRRVY